MRHTHSNRLERWLPPASVQAISDAMVDWYGPPIPVRGIPGAVYAARGGDFLGPIEAGRFAGVMDFAEDRWRSAKRRVATDRHERFHAGFASLSELIAAATTGGNRRRYTFYKSGTGSAAAGHTSLWRVGPVPAAGSAAGAAPGGTAPDDSTTGAFPFSNPTGGDTQHLTKMEGTASIAGNTLLMYDRLFAVAKTMASVGTEAVSGVPTRYQSITSTDMDYAGGNFLFAECGTVLANTAHNWTVCKYTNQGGTTLQTLPSVTGVAACAANRLDQTNGWFMPLATGDTGIQALTQMQCSGSVATGAIDFVMGHPLAILPNVVALNWFVLPLINDAFNLERVFDDACLAFLGINHVSGSSCTFSGVFETISS
jgi:hypothetical protein